MNVDFMNLTAQRLHNKPVEWRWWEASSIDMPSGFIKLRGGIPVGVFSRGPRKGQPKPPKQLDVVHIQRSEVEQVRLVWELETGKCSNCDGSGQEVYGYSVSEGERRRKCDRCDGTGNPVEPGVAA